MGGTSVNLHSIVMDIYVYISICDIVMYRWEDGWGHVRNVSDGGLEMCFTPYGNTQRVPLNHSPIGSEVVIDTFRSTR